MTYRLSTPVPQVIPDGYADAPVERARVVLDPPSAASCRARRWGFARRELSRQLDENNPAGIAS